MFFYRPDPNAPLRTPHRRDDKRVMDDCTGDAGRDGYTRLSTANRENGHRPSVGSVPAFPRRPVE